MNNIAVKQFHDVMKVKDESSLPPHISYNEYQSLLNEIENNLLAEIYIACFQAYDIRDPSS